MPAIVNGKFNFISKNVDEAVTMHDVCSSYVCT